MSCIISAVWGVGIWVILTVAEKGFFKSPTHWICLFLPLVLSGLVHGFESLLLSLHTFVVVGLLMSGALVLKSDI